MAVRNPTASTKVRVRIMTVNREQNLVEGILPDNGKVAVAVWETPVSFRWPKVDEIWTAHRAPGQAWTLGCRVVDRSDLEPGELRLDGDKITNAQGKLVGADTYTHVQLDSSTTWDITHNLGRFPSVTVVDSAGSVVFGDVQYVSDQELILNFGSPFTGTAYLN